MILITSLYVANIHAILIRSVYDALATVDAAKEYHRILIETNTRMRNIILSQERPLTFVTVPAATQALLRRADEYQRSAP